MLLTLTRLIESPAFTFGILNADGLKFCTLELPWKNNQRQVSRIPKGFYAIHRIVTTKGRETFQIQDVPDRTEILFDIANYTKELRGCVALGMGLLIEPPMVTNSTQAMQEFMEIMKGSDVGNILIEEKLL